MCCTITNSFVRSHTICRSSHVSVVVTVHIILRNFQTTCATCLFGRFSLSSNDLRKITTVFKWLAQLTQSKSSDFCPVTTTHTDRCFQRVIQLDFMANELRKMRIWQMSCANYINFQITCAIPLRCLAVSRHAILRRHHIRCAAQKI